MKIFLCLIIFFIFFGYFWGLGKFKNQSYYSNILITYILLLITQICPFCKPEGKGGATTPIIKDQKFGVRQGPLRFVVVRWVLLGSVVVKVIVDLG